MSWVDECISSSITLSLDLDSYILTTIITPDLLLRAGLHLSAVYHVIPTLQCNLYSPWHGCGTRSTRTKYSGKKLSSNENSLDSVCSKEGIASKTKHTMRNSLINTAQFSYP